MFRLMTLNRDVFACLFLFVFNYSRKFSIQEPDPEILNHLKYSNNFYTFILIFKNFYYVYALQLCFK